MVDLSRVIQLFSSFFDSGLFLALQILGGILSLVLVVGVIMLIQKGGALERHIQHLWISWNASPLSKRRMVKRWLSIKELMKQDNPEGWRAAILGADAMLDEIVKRLGCKGTTLAERFQNTTEYQFPMLEDARRAHEISNFLEEDSSYPLTREVSEKTIGIYRNIFRETGIIL